MTDERIAAINNGLEILLYLLDLAHAVKMHAEAAKLEQAYILLDNPMQRGDFYLAQERVPLVLNMLGEINEHHLQPFLVEVVTLLS